MANINDLKAKYSKTNLEPTAADFKAVIGQPVIRIHGLGVRGLRFSVVSVDEKKGTVLLDDGKGEQTSCSFVECCIAPIKPRS